jgi:hypothetical protein
MSIRTIALAIPLALGIACKTSSTHSSKDHTGAMWTARSAPSEPRKPSPTGDSAAVAAATASMQGAGSQGQGGTGSAGAPSGPDSGAMASGGSSGTMGSSPQGQDQGQPGSEQGKDQGAPGPGSAGMGWSGMGSQDTTGTGGTEGATRSDSAGAPGSSDVPGHPADQVVTGTVSKLAKQSISIKSEQGEAKKLKIVPQTVVTMNGKTVKLSQLKPGQQVRASYDQQDVAVTIEVSGGAAASGGHKSNGHMKGQQGEPSGSTGSSPHRY